MITVVLDDDPTGTQAISDVSVVLDWSDPGVWSAVEPGDHGVHMLTNSRAHTGDEAGVIVADAAAAARQRFPDARQILRGDSTLRAHLWEEYEALRSVIAPEHPNTPLLLVPAFPAAGRVTIGATHLLERDGRRIPLDRTEYARDGALAYTSADLRLWADERSGGRLAAADAVAVPLEQLRTPDGHAAVAAAIVSAAAGRTPAVVVPDAETDADLDAIARGLEAAEAAGASVIVRCAPAFAGVLTGSQASTTATAPSGDGGVLVVCGSFVAGTTAQLEQLAHVHPQAGVTAHVAALAGESWEDEVDRLAAAAGALIERDGLAVVATERQRDPGLVAADAQRRIAVALAQVARRVYSGVVVAKGGITSAVTAREGLGARSARVVGPILPGVALWKLSDGTDYVIVPGNIGGPELLADVVAAIGPVPVSVGEPQC